MNNTSYLRTAPAAKYCGISASLLNRLRVIGGGPVYSKLGKVVVYAAADLDAWITAGKRGSTSEHR